MRDELFSMNKGHKTINYHTQNKDMRHTCRTITEK